MEKQFNWRNSRINYTTFGDAKELLICFHGYGQQSTIFNILEPSLSLKYKVVSIDLPFQGKTVWREKEKLTKELLGDLMTQFLDHIHAPAKVSLMAYSIGGNYALGFVTAFPERINEIWLLAADGLKRKRAFDFVTKTGIGQNLFKAFVLYPRWLFYTLRIASFFGFINKRVSNFYFATIETELKRQDLIDRWSSTARIAPNLSLSVQVLNEHRIRVVLIYGKKDSVIPYANAIAFDKKIINSKLVLMNLGHKLLVQKTNGVIKDIIDINKI